MPVVRWIGKGLAGLVAVLIVALCVIYGVSQWKLTRKGVPPARAAVTVTPDAALLARGQVLTQAYGCQECHGEHLAGRVFADDAAFGRLVASNLTAGTGGVLAHYSDAALDAAIRDGVSWDGRKLLIMPSVEYSGMADDDLAAIIASIRARPAANNVLPRTTMRPVGRGLIAAGVLPIGYDVIDHSRSTRAKAPRGGTVEQGRYIAANCVGCHGNDYGGGEVPGAPRGATRASNLTPSGHLATWTQSDFITVFRTGVRPDGTKLDPLMPWSALGRMSDEELQAVYLYLRTVPPTVVASK